MHRRFLGVPATWWRAALPLLAAVLVCVVLVGTSSAQPSQRLDLPRAQTLYVGRTGVPLVPNANPLLSSTASDAGLRQGLFEYLYYFNWITGRAEPWLAQSATYNKTFTALKIQIRHGVRWSDGVPFTSADVVYTLKALQQNPTLVNASVVSSEVKSVTAAGRYTVDIQLSKPDRRFIGNVLAGYISSGVTIVPEHIFQGQDPTTFTFFDLSKGWPVGTGPYKLTSWEGGRAVFTEDPHWWAVKAKFHKLPAPKYLVYETVTPDIEAQSLVTNQLDSSSGNINGVGTWQSISKQNKQLGTWSPNGFVDPCPISLEMNTTVDPWSDPQMRWALNYAIDKASFSHLFNQGPAYVTPFFFPDYPKLRQVLKDNAALYKKYPTTQYSLAKSAQILTSKGYHMSGGKWVNSQGQPLTVNLTTFSPTVAASWGVAREALTTQLEAAGFTVNSQALDFGGMFGALAPGKFDTITWFECGSVSEPWQTLNRYTNLNLAPIGQANPTPNNVRWNNPQYTAIVNKLALLPASSPQAKKLTTQALTIFAQQLPVIELTQAPKTIIFSTRYWTNWPTATNPYLQPQPQLNSFHQLLLRLKAAR
jgi:peptide/nickel transport system substrate-binding protein